MYRKWSKPNIKIPIGLIITICVFPAVLIGLFYALRGVVSFMDWTAEHISAPIRGFMGMVSSVYPFSVMEILLTTAGVWLIYYMVRTVMVTVRRRGKMKIMGKRMLLPVVAALYAYCLFCWTWNCGYHATGFAIKNGFEGGGISVEDLASVTKFFADNANNLAPLMERDENGRYIGDRSSMFAASVGIYENIASEFPNLEGRVYAPKPMLYSWLMSRTGYTGIYFAPTGESNINTRTPAFLMPATVSHELAHQLGVFAEDEASFVGIAACTSSGDSIFEYSGYVSGLMYLMNALFTVDDKAWSEINYTICPEIRTDWQYNYDYWQSQKKVETGIEFIDRVLTSVTQTVSDAVDTVYDGYLKSQNQELGIKSYGACVDLLVEYYIKRIT